MRTLFVNDSSRNPNWGCRATSGSLRALLVAAGADIVDTVYLERLSRFEVHDRSDWHRWSRRLDPLLPRRPIVRELATRAFDRLRPLVADVVPEDAEGLEPAARRMLSGEIFTDIMTMLERSDALVINAEGGIYDHQRKGRVMLFLAYLARVHLDLPTAVVNHTADLSDPRMRSMAERVYPLLSDVTFRETRSQAACSSFRHGDVVPDAAFRYRPSPREAWRAVAAQPDYYGVWPDHATPFDPTQPYACVGGSCLLLRPDRPAHDPTPGYRRLIEELLGRFGQVVLTASDRPDERIFRPLAAAYGLPLIGLATPVQQVVDLLGNADVYIGGRWHPIIFAASGGTPSVILSACSHKNEGIADMLDLGPTFDTFDLEARAAATADAAVARADEGAGLRARLEVSASRYYHESAAHAGMVERLTSGAGT